MKRVFNTNEVAHIWAAQKQDSGRNANNNFYFRDATIYSYGSHFPIATIEGEDVFFTLRTYSNTTAKHLSKARGAISHKNIIWCYDVPVKYYDTKKHIKEHGLLLVHENNITVWKNEIKATFEELGNKRIRDTQSRINTIKTHINRLTAYCNYFKLPIKDNELKQLLKLAVQPDFLEQARQAKEKQIAANVKKLQQSAKAYSQYLKLWRNYDNEAIQAMPDKTKDLCNYYANNTAAFTHLRYNKEQSRVETSKGVQIPVEIAKRAYVALNGCMQGKCNGLNIPVLHYSITETGNDYIKAGCHTIQKADVQYIAALLNW